ncbi:MAG: sugar phosphate isomerase/epimerase [Candidatus Nealsonbacteria bacterium]|nr:sugar phosphate isomerase/epimerase [Candidatus Nealsonbacteria bacterium]
MTRRTMLSRSAAALAATAVSFEPLLAASDARRFKIGACDWSIGKHSSIEAFDVAKQIGLDGVQISMGTVKNEMQLRKPEMQRTYLEAVKKTGQQMASLAIGEMNSVPLKSDPRAAKWLDESIDVCKALGLDVVMPACFGKGDLDMGNKAEIDQLVKVLKDVAPKAEKAGVSIGLEDYLSAEDNMKIIERVGSPAMKVYYDVGNSTDKGRDIFKEIRLLGKLICEFHAKDGPHMLGRGRIDFRKVREAIDEIGYNGWIIIEAARPNGLIPDYQAHCKHLREVFPAQG